MMFIHLLFIIYYLYNGRVIWDETLIPSEVNHIPMDYTPSKPIETSDITTLHIQRFFVNYMNNDNLGQIANAHLAKADQSHLGAKNGSCKVLAQLHSQAVGKYINADLINNNDVDR